jgi:hypothetical protein
LAANSHPCYEASSLAFSEFIGIATHNSSFPSLFTFSGTIKGSEKSLDYPNRALDRGAYENLRSTHKVDYSLFEAYQNLKLKRGERDLADRYARLCAAHGSFGSRLRLPNTRTHMLLGELEENGLKGELVDFVWVDISLLYTQGGLGDKLNVARYVDEVQDLLLIDTRRTFHN